MADIKAGPLREDELRRLGDNYTINPIGAKLKPNGKIRLLVDASSPHDKDEMVPGWIYSPLLPGSVNSTIDTGKFPTKMYSVPKFVKSLWQWAMPETTPKFIDSMTHTNMRQLRLG